MIDPQHEYRVPEKCHQAQSHERPGKPKGHGWKDSAPKEITSYFSGPEPPWLPSVASESLGVGVTTANGSSQPLLEPRHVGIVEGHLGLNAPNAVSTLSQTQAEIRLFSCYEVWIVAVHINDRPNPHHGIAAAGIGEPNWRIPFDVT
jgi:hypothetical protein